LRYAGQLRGLRGKRLEERIDELMALFSNWTRAHRRASGFSRGQQARSSLARAILH
jgi:ABC-type multidrug transport system ATPase subunit